MRENLKSLRGGGAQSARKMLRGEVLVAGAWEARARPQGLQQLAWAVWAQLGVARLWIVVRGQESLPQNEEQIQVWVFGKP